MIKIDNFKGFKFSEVITSFTYMDPIENKKHQKTLIMFSDPVKNKITYCIEYFDQKNNKIVTTEEINNFEDAIHYYNKI